jgi:hypothetical protein
MRRPGEVAAAAGILTALLSGCGSPSELDVRTATVHGILERTAAETGPEGWILTTDSGSILPVEPPDGADDAGSHTCVRILVNDDFRLSDDERIVTERLRELVDQTGEPLVVESFC